MQGCPIVITGPSGAGKSTICRRMQAMFPGAAFSVSATTRPPRGDERNGVHYHFLTPDEFERDIRAGEFLEWEEVHGWRYGTRRAELLAALATHPLVLLDVDPKGGLSIRAAYPEAGLVFLKPPSPAAQLERLERRREDPQAVIERRLQRTREELALAERYDLVVVNDRLEETVGTVAAFIRERMALRELTHGS